MELSHAILVLLSCLTIVAGAAYVKRRKARQSAAKEAERRKQEAERIGEEVARINELLTEIEGLKETITTLSAFESGYLMKRDWDRLLSRAHPTLKALSEMCPKAIEASGHASLVEFVTKSCTDSRFRENRNERFKAHELKQCDSLLSNIDGGKSLDPQQRDAVITDEYSNLVIAGAGSGKTSVVVGKVKYLVNRWGVAPNEILVTSFTRASVDDLKTRIEASGVSGVATKTFHAIGLGVLGNVAVAPENALERHITSYLSHKLAADPKQAAAFLEFFGMWSLAPDETQGSSEAEAKMKLLKAQDMRTLKGLVDEVSHEGTMDTMRGERVKSIEELMIANFLFLNGVSYEYERPYDKPIPHKLASESRRAYQPDFYLSDYDIWLEHFGIDERGRVPWMKTPIEEQAYLDGMDWKRKVHAACNTKLIESYSYWNKDQDLLNRVEALLCANGVRLSIDPERNATLCANLLRDQRLFGSMTQLISTFISLVKSGNRTAAEVDDRARETYRGAGAMWHRYDLFTRFAWPIMESYQESLSRDPTPMVDFDDMINRAAERIRDIGYPFPYRYIIVDEYQDISLSRFGLLSAVRDATGAKLLCVGDDWQAIYRFAGSDVTLFTNFGKLVGFYEEMRIERTYRNSQALVNVASRFILMNPHQLKKTVTSMAPPYARPPVAAVSLTDQRAAFTFAVNDLLSTDGGGDILVLGRNRRDLEKVFPGYESADGFSIRDPKRGDPSETKYDKVITYRRTGKQPVRIGYMTVHKSKGLQADNVIVIGLVNDRYGFPNMVADDPILELLLANSDSYEFAEERRLFYVALTRTRGRVWLVTGDNSGNPGISLFVDELHRDNDGRSFVLYTAKDSGAQARCPRCGGTLLRRSGQAGDFVGCSNYPFCDKTYRDVRILTDRKPCPRCGGWLTRRINGRDGTEFFGCTNYPTCTYTTQDSRRDVRPNRPGNERSKGCDSKSPPTGAQSSIREWDSRPQITQYHVGKRPQEHHMGTPTRREDGPGTTPRCPKCGAAMALKSGPYGSFFGCMRYPACKGKRSCENPRSFSSEAKAKDAGSGRVAPTCPKCGERMVLRTSSYGKFYGCQNYPSCTGKRRYPS